MRGTSVSRHRLALGVQPEACPLDVLYRRFGPAITCRARTMLRDDDEALDVTQETFLAYLRCQASLRGEASAFTVLYRIATNKAMDRLRRDSRWTSTFDSLESREEEDVPCPEPWSPQEGDLARVEALMELGVLTRGESRLLLTAAIRYFVEGYSQEEVARALETSRKNVSEMLRGFTARARKRGGAPTP
jgi:RNA polymerase sigma-70 factor (ECF subfamily)